ncbi:GntR family transcriptional regulator [Hydrogenophaga atypica]|jgi:GntR family transcriptional regulator|uniref:GntR family transcriptional regulator n=1 Tax=Hydrogenophaga atypica TaxID=249409 RepID=A0ABW2QQC9_9BURK
MSEILQPLYARLRDALRGDILAGRLRVHDKLPSEHELVQAHGVSRITVRQALADLQREGLITRLQGKGAYVSAPRTTQALQRLEGLGEALSAHGQAVHSQRLSMKRLKGSPDVVSALQLSPGSEVYQLRTLRYVDRLPVSLNESHYPLPLGERMVRLDLSGRDVIEVLEHDLGLRVSQARMEISAVPMPKLAAKWLQATPDGPALQVRRVLLDDEGKPLQLETATHHADRFSYQLTMSR